MTQKRLASNGHHHVEAFCLMHYACRCGHHEVIWNSRDGVTPFSAPCPSCGDGMGMTHVAFNADVYAPGHQPHHGQRIWVDMTWNRAEEIAKARIAAATQQGYTGHVNVANLAASIFNEGRAPDMRVQNFGYVHGTV